MIKTTYSVADSIHSNDPPDFDPLCLPIYFKLLYVEGFKCQLGFNKFLTNNTKELVYKETQEASLVQVQHSITMGAILGNL